MWRFRVRGEYYLFGGYPDGIFHLKYYLNYFMMSFSRFSLFKLKPYAIGFSLPLDLVLLYQSCIHNVQNVKEKR